MITYLFFILSILIMTCLNSLGALFFKDTMTRIKVFSIKKVFALKFLYAGIFCYFLGSIINILLMKTYDYSTVYPMTSLTCLWTLFFSRLFLKEKITLRKVISIPLILIGAFLVSL